MLSLNNTLNHTISSNDAEVEATFQFKDTQILEKCPTFSGEGKYNYMLFMKTIDILKEDFNIPD